MTIQQQRCLLPVSAVLLVMLLLLLDAVHVRGWISPTTTTTTSATTGCGRISRSPVRAATTTTSGRSVTRSTRAPLFYCLGFGADNAGDSSNRRRHSHKHKHNPTSRLYAKYDDEDDDDDEEDDLDVGGADWRDFRAKLVMQSRGVVAEDDSEGSTKTADKDGTDSSWIYESGDVIETGSIVISKTSKEATYGGFNQQYFHKCVVLIVSHDENFTKGVILNRPTDMYLSLNDIVGSFTGDAVKSGKESAPKDSMSIWYGGDVQGFGWKWMERDWTCLHQLGDVPEAVKVSDNVLQDIYSTSLKNAELLIKDGRAKANDFYLFSGYAGWGPGQLQGELERFGWYMVAMDSKAVFRNAINKDANPLDGGIDTWGWIMDRIGKKDPYADKVEQIFVDNMSKEWSRTHTTIASSENSLTKSASSMTRSTIKNGDILCASSAFKHDRPPFWPDQPIFHKSLVLVMRKEDHYTLGVILNRPSAGSVQLKSGLTLPVRYGGAFDVRLAGQKPLAWFHYDHPALVEASVGDPVGPASGIWGCSQADAEIAVSMGLATFEDFLVIEGVTVWKTDEPNTRKNLEKEIQKGYMDIIPSESKQLADMWKILKKQPVLTSGDDLDGDVGLGSLAWETALHDSDDKKAGTTSRQVRGSDLTIQDLSNQALERWIRAFLRFE